jgi:hypothetical protein
MTEGERAYLKRRLREEMQLAGTVGCTERKAQHLEWAGFFNARLEGKRVSEPPQIH